MCVCMLGNYFGFSVFAEKYNGMNYATFLFISSKYYLNEKDIYSHFSLFILYKKNKDLRYIFLSLLCSTWGHYCILPVFFVPVSFVKECTDLLMSKSKSLLIVFVAYHHNANVNPRGYNEFISRFCVLAVCM